ncbi:MAG: hypothetical protein ACXVP0_12300 [Bacteroidia bacterium]
MSLKTIFLAAGLLCSVYCFSQSCVTNTLPANYAAQRSNYTNYLAATAGTLLPHDTCFQKQLSIMFYLVTDSTGATNVPPANITANINNLNKFFKPLCISFQNCSTQVIPEYHYGKHWDKTYNEPKVLGTYYAANTLNVYVVDSIYPAGSGYTYMPPVPSGKDIIVINKQAFNSPGGYELVHQMGHVFGLPHTYAEITALSAMGPTGELVRRINCKTNGDGFCDTDADGTGTDANSDYYATPRDNIMSSSSTRCRFTLEQYNFMAYTFLVYKTYLN